jgi:hypothetical protein
LKIPLLALFAFKAGVGDASCCRNWMDDEFVISPRSFPAGLHRFDALEKVQHARHAEPVKHLRAAFFVFQNANALELAQMA